jgi:hypothetical protein
MLSLDFRLFSLRHRQGSACAWPCAVVLIIYTLRGNL